MNSSGDAAEQVVRLSLEGTEVALKLTGAAAKNIAAALYAVFRNRDKTKTKGHQRLSAMLKSGKELKVFTIREEHLRQFAKEAKRYGVVYCALRGKGRSDDGMVDLMVRAEDASKINRIVERFKMATVDAASIKREIEKDKVEKGAAQAEQESAAANSVNDEALLDEMLGAAPPKEVPDSPNPNPAQMEKSPPSEPTSETPSKADEGTVEKAEQRPSVRQELREIQAQQKAKEATSPEQETEQPRKKSPKSPQHQQPKSKNKKKKKAKEK